MTLDTSVDKDTGVAVVTLDRPRKLNAIDLTTAAELTAVWRELRFDDSVKAVVLTGAGSAPSAPGSTGTRWSRSPTRPTCRTIRCCTSARRPTTCGSR